MNNLLPTTATYAINDVEDTTWTWYGHDCSCSLATETHLGEQGLDCSSFEVNDQSYHPHPPGGLRSKAL